MRRGCIDDIDVLRSGGMKTLFDVVYAPSTIGTLLREFTFGHARQLESVLVGHLARLCERVDLLPGADVRAFIDIDSLLRPVYGHAKQGASYGHTKIAGKQVLRKGLSPLATTISTDLAAPVIAGMQLRAGKSNSGKGAGRMIAQAIATARAAGITGQILVRGDSAYGTRAVIGAARRAGAQFSLVLTKNTAVQKAIDAIGEDGWTPVRYRGAVQDPDTGVWISDAEVAEISYTALASTKDAITARLIVRRVKNARHRDALFPVWRYHPFFTNSDEPLADADITHRRHAIIETTFADLIDGPLAHMPSGHFGANSAWVLCAAIAHNLLRAAATLAGAAHAAARGATLRRKIVNIAARLTHPQRRPVLHYPPTGPGLMHGLHCGATPSNPIRRRTASQPDHRRKARTPTNRKSWVDQPPTHARTPVDQDQSTATPQSALVGESRLRRSDEDDGGSGADRPGRPENSTPYRRPCVSPAAGRRTRRGRRRTAVRM